MREHRSRGLAPASDDTDSFRRTPAAAVAVVPMSPCPCTAWRKGTFFRVLVGLEADRHARDDKARREIVVRSSSIASTCYGFPATKSKL